MRAARRAYTPGVRWIRGALIVIALGAAFAPLAGWGWLQHDGRTLRGIRVAGRRLAPTADPAAALGPRADAFLDRELGVRAGPVLVVRTRRQLGARLPLDALAAELLALGHAGHPLRDLGAWWDARRGRVEHPWPLEVDRARLRDFGEGLRDLVDRAPVAARLGRDGQLLEAAHSGWALDVGASVDALERALRGGEVVTELVVREEHAAPPPLPRGELRLLASWATRFGRSRSRAHNVRLAAERLDGARVPAGGALSFNGRVGARPRGAGYRTAGVIVNGELVDGVGGGTCQVASTLHAAAFLAGFEIVEHRPHSRPAGYVPLGLDATVVWPEVDLVVRNPYPFPVRVRARAEGRELRVDLLGSAAPPSVTWSRQILSTEPPGERVVEDAAVGWGAAEVSQDGIPGYTVLRRRTIDRGAGPIVEERVLRYPPTDRIVRIPPKQPAS